MKTALALVFSLVAGSPLFAQGSTTLRVVCWNVEGNGNDIDPDVIEQQLASKEGVDLWGLSEVRPSLFDEFERGAADGEGGNFKTIEGTTGGNIRLGIIFDESRLQLLEFFELDDDDFRNHRDPLVAKFRGRESGITFFFMVNHLASGDASANFDQALKLNNWASSQTLPIVCTGDFNFRENATTGDARPGLAVMRNGPWTELQPLSRMPTFHGFNSILDHFFVANPSAVQGWSHVTRVLRRRTDGPATAPDFSDDDEQSDHRPVEVIFTVPTSGVARSTDEAGRVPGLEDRVADLEEKLDTLESKLDEILSLLRE